MLLEDQVASYEEKGFLHVPEVFSKDEIEAMDQDHQYLTSKWASTDMGWTGDWRKAYMDEKTEKVSKLTALHDLHFYSAAWMKAVTHPKLVKVISDLLGPEVELHHSTMHTKPPQTGHPFPMHQDNAFYEHSDGRYVDVLVHLDDTCHENGEIRFLSGSHKGGYCKHITETPQGPCTPHLPTDAYPLKDSTAVPARRGDVVLFNIFTVHGSYINTTDKARRLVRIGYKHPENRQQTGQSLNRPSLMVHGIRKHHDGAQPFPLE
jgi:ectoine hydroxylase-related dioxygenase (phytanoyl-CoA dioxygenase family)